MFHEFEKYIGLERSLKDARNMDSLNSEIYLPKGSFLRVFLNGKRR